MFGNESAIAPGYIGHLAWVSCSPLTDWFEVTNFKRIFFIIYLLKITMGRVKELFLSSFLVNSNTLINRNEKNGSLLEQRETPHKNLRP